MNHLTDQQLIRNYLARKSEPAFSQLVHRYIDLVYSAALRMTVESHLAKDVTQNVFVSLAQSATQLADRESIAGWLHFTTRNIAVKMIRSEVRRRNREQEAVVMNDLLSNASDLIWDQIAPQLDNALSELNENDREALLLRYFQNLDLRSVGTTLGISDDAAQKRVSRAVERLREFFVKRGVTVGASGLAVVLSANAVQAAPVGLALTISTAAALTGTTLATTATVTVTKAIAMTALQKTIVTAIVAVLAGAGIYEARQAAQLREQVQTLQQQKVPLTEENQRLQSELGAATNRLAASRHENERLNRNSGELLKLRGQVAGLRAESQELSLLKAASLEKANDPTEKAMRTWVSRALDLQKRIEKSPEAKIPELQFLAATDWLDIAKDASLESDQDISNAAQMLGTLAKDRFAGILRDALNKFVEANTGELPSDIYQLKPFFPVTVEDAVLQRYELLRSGNVKDVAERDRLFRLVGEKRFAPAGSGRPIVQIGMQGFIRTGQ